MQNKTTVLLLIVTAIASASLTRYLWPKVQTQTVEVTKEVVKTDIRTIVRIVEHPDGTKESTTETVDHSIANSSNSKSATVYAQKDWLVGLTIGSEFAKLEPIYGLQVNKRILGPFFGSVSATTNKQINLGLGMEF